MNMTNSYRCPKCDHGWSDDYACAVDHDCPECGTTCTPIASVPWVDLHDFDYSKVKFAALDTVIRRLESLPEPSFNLGSWLRGPTPVQALHNECGTTLCVVGALAAADELGFYIDEDLDVQHQSENSLLAVAFAEETGLEENLVYYLIHPSEMYYGLPDKEQVLEIFYQIKEIAHDA